MYNKKNLAQALLTTTSFLAITTGAAQAVLGASARQVQSNNATIEANSAAGLNGGDPFIPSSTLQYSTEYNTVTVNAPTNILAAYINAFPSEHTLMTINANTELGSVVKQPNYFYNLPISIGNAALTLTGTSSDPIGFYSGDYTANANDYSGLLTISFNDPNGVLNINDGITIASNITGAGTINFLGSGSITAGKYIGIHVDTINFNGTGNVTLASNGTTIEAKTFNINDAGANITVIDPINGDINYTASGTLNAERDITGNVDFAGTNGTLEVAANQTITGAVDSTNNAGGTLNFGGGSITGAIGATNPLTTVNLNGATTLNSSARAIDFNINNTATNTALGLLSGNINYTASGTLNVNGGIINGNINFNNNAGTLAINSTAEDFIILNAGFKSAGIANLLIDSNITITDTSIETIANIKIADNKTLNLDINANLALAAGLGWVFSGQNSTISFINAGQNKAIIFVGNIASPDDDTGKLEFSSGGANPSTLIIAAAANITLGTDATHRLRQLVVSGDQQLVFTDKITIFAKSLIMNNSNSVSINNPLNLGADSNLIFNESGTINLPNGATITTTTLEVASDKSPTIKGDINSSNFNLNNGKLTLNGNANLTGDIVLNTSLDGTEIGHILVVGNGHKFDFSGATSTKIVLDATDHNQLVPNQIYKFNILKTAEQAQIVPDSGKIDFTIINGNRYVNWSQAAENQTITAIYQPDGVITDVKASNGNSNQVTVAEGISNAATSNSNSAAGQVVNNLGTLPTAEDVTNAIEQLIINAGETIDTVATAADGAIEATGSRLLAILQLANAEEELGTAAGEDNAVAKHGIWLSPLYGKVIQKDNGLDLGYKMTNYGAVIGADTMLNDSLTVGAAFVLTKTNIKHNVTTGAYKGKADINIISLYASQQFSQDYFMLGTGFAGWSKLKNAQQRRINVNLSQIANAEYHSHSYGMQLLGGRNFNLTQQAIQLSPMAGIRYGIFKDSGYTETGASIQNLSVSKKSLYSLEAIIGGEVNYTTLINDLIVKPELRAFVNYNIKTKTPTLDMKLDGMVTPIRIKGQKASSAWYSLSTGLLVKNKQTDYGIFYEIQLDKKYVGHQGMLKLRVNF